MVGFKKGFAPANRKAAELMRTPGFGRVQFVSASYPQGIPTQDELDRYLHNHEPVPAAVAFLDHLCHPMSLLVSLVGAPVTLFFQRAPSGAGVATFTHPSGAVSVLHLSHGASWNGGLERTCIVGDAGQHIVVENNVRVSLHRNPVTEGGYGAAPDFYGGGTDHATALWEPEFSLGQLYNKGLFLLGYYGEITEFAAAVLEDREPIHAGLRDAWAVTHTFRAFARGEGRVHALTPTPEL
jgi:predicted dehydrogenase